MNGTWLSLLFYPWWGPGGKKKKHQNQNQNQNQWSMIKNNHSIRESIKTDFLVEFKFHITKLIQNSVKFLKVID